MWDSNPRYPVPKTGGIAAILISEKLEDRVGLEPTMWNSRLKVCAVRHYGNQSISVAKA